MSEPMVESELPLPPAFLMERVVPMGDNPPEVARETFRRSGERSLAELQRALAACDRSLDEFSDLLDWGCGPGRVTLRIIEKHPHLRVTGIDTDHGSIDWLRGAVPNARFGVVSPLPPTDLEADAFDIVVNHSVLTHIDYEPQRAWMAEIARVLRPNGIFVTSVHGVQAFIDQLRFLADDSDTANQWVRAWQANRFVFVTEDTFTGSSHHDGYHTTFQDAAGLETIGDFEFEPLAVLHHGDLGFQDLVVLRRRTPTEAAERRAIEDADEHALVEVNTAPADDGSRLARLERVSAMANLSLAQLGRQIARLEESFHTDR